MYGDCNSVRLRLLDSGLDEVSLLRRYRRRPQPERECKWVVLVLECLDDT